MIQGIKNIANKDQYFADVLKINKELNQNKLRISMTADGQVNLNAVHKFNPSELYGLGRNGRAELFSSLGAANVATPNVPTRVAPTTTAVGRYIEAEDEPSNNILVNINPGEIIRVGSLLIRVSAAGAEEVANLLENLSQEAYSCLMSVAFNVLSKLIPDEIGRLRLLSPDEDLIVQIVKFVFNYLKHKRPMGEPRSDDNGIVIVLKEFLQDGIIRQDTILHIKELLLLYVDKKLKERNSLYPNKKQVICQCCGGVSFA